MFVPNRVQSRFTLISVLQHVSLEHRKIQIEIEKGWCTADTDSKVSSVGPSWERKIKNVKKKKTYTKKKNREQNIQEFKKTFRSLKKHSARSAVYIHSMYSVNIKDFKKHIDSTLTIHLVPSSCLARIRMTTKVVRDIVLWIRSFATIVWIPRGVWERENPVLETPRK